MNDANKLVIFNWDGVIESRDNACLRKAYKMLSEKLGISTKGTYQNLWLAMHQHSALCSCRESDVVDIVKEVFGVGNKAWYATAVQDFTRAYTQAMSGMPYNLSALQYAKQLQTQGILKVGITGTLNCFDMPRFNYQVNPSDYQYSWLSCSRGLMFPDNALFTLIELETSIAPRNILFFDATTMTVGKAQQRKWQAYCGTCNDTEMMKRIINEFCFD